MANADTLMQQPETSETTSASEEVVDVEEVNLLSEWHRRRAAQPMCATCGAVEGKFHRKDLCRECYNQSQRKVPGEDSRKGNSGRKASDLPKPLKTCQQCAVTSEFRTFATKTSCSTCYNKNPARRSSQAKCVRKRYIPVCTRRKLGIEIRYMNASQWEAVGMACDT